ncbi:MAG: amidohydrolase family protein [Candidatus Caldatribacteriota bacterium]|nr:amidohydrolase family protein [Candidatus Caldatribacteriota bacterium]
MSFQLNNAQQMAINDSLYNLTQREMKHLNNSWAETFTKKIFPFIKEDRFSVLYSDNPASRPNNPINVYFGLLILRALKIFTEDASYALHENKGRIEEGMLADFIVLSENPLKLSPKHILPLRVLQTYLGGESV